MLATVDPSSHTIKDNVMPGEIDRTGITARHGALFCPGVNDEFTRTDSTALWRW